MPPIDLERRRRRNRRLSILGLAAALLCVLAVAGYAIQRNRSDGAARQRIVDSAAAFDQGDYERVIELLEDLSTPTNTLRDAQGDAQAMWRYVVARREVELRNGEHIARLFPALRQVVALDPANHEAGTMLLTLLIAIDRNTEALDTADRLVTAHPGDVEMLRFRYQINMLLNRKGNALDDALEAAQAEPLNVRTQMDVATLMQELNRDGQQFFDRAEALLKAHPGDPRAEVIAARANLLVGDVIEAQELLRTASDRDAPDMDFVRIMVESLDLIGYYEESYTYLSREAGNGLESPLQYELFFRDFEAENNQRVIDRAATVDADEAHENILALTAISHKRLGDDLEAEALRARLAARSDSPLAQHWARCLEAWWLTPAQPGRLVAACIPACEENPYHAYLHYLLAVGYRAVGELEAAVAELETTHEARRSWAYPYYMRAELLLELGRPAEAYEAAQLALYRRSAPAYAATLAVAQARATNPNDGLAVERAMAYIDDKVQAAFPGEPRTFVAAVELLARSAQRDLAIGRIRDALDREEPLPQDALIELADVSRTYGLGMEQAVYQRAESAYGLSPRLVLDQSLAAVAEGDKDRAVAIIRDAMPSPVTLPWRVAEAQILEYTKNPEAPAAWVRLADDYPNDLGVQRMALASVGVRDDRAFAVRVIERMREMGGPDSVGWKIERARYLLGSEDPEAVARQATDLLEEVIVAAPNRVEPYRLLARCQTLRGDNTAAARSIEQAANLAPDDMRIQFQLGQLLHNERQWVAARQPLLRVARNDRAEPNLRLSALVLLSRQEEVDTLVPILEGLRQQYTAPDQLEILLADLYTVTGRATDADGICEAMLRDPSPQAIAFAADYYWRTGRPDQAKQVVELVNEVEMAPDLRHTILGQHAARLGEPDLALNHYHAAALAVPEQAGRWQRVVLMSLVFGRPNEAVAYAREALGHVPDDAGMRAVTGNAQTIQRIAGDPRFRPMAATIAGDPDHREVAVRALRMVISTAENQRSTAALARDLAALAGEYPECLPLQNLAAALLTDVRRFEQAAEVATRAMGTFPADGMSARLATVALAQSGQWRRTISAAQTWGRRTPSQRMLADVYLSVAQRNLGRVDDALVTLQPHIETANAAPDQHITFLGEYATALVQRGRVDEAWAVLEPNLASGLAWRNHVMLLAGGSLSSARQATQWLDAVERALPADSPIEWVLFAQASFDAGSRLRDATLTERARTVAERLSATDQAPPEVWTLRARIASESGDLLTAEECYRKAIALQPDAHYLKNNLAMVLVARGRNLDEAVDLARAATRAAPDDPNSQDTLAKALSRAGQHDEALRIIELAIQRDRQNMAWVETKAQVLDAAGREAEAQRLRERYGIAP